MYTQSSLRTLVKVAQAIQNNPEYSDYIMEVYGMDKEAATSANRKHTNKIKQSMKNITRAGEKQSVRLADAIMTQAADPESNITLIPDTKHPGRFLPYNPNNEAHRMYLKEMKKHEANITPEQWKNFRNTIVKAQNNAQKKVNAVPALSPDPRKSGKHKAQAQAELDAKGTRTNLDIAKQEGATYGGRGGRVEKPLPDTNDGKSLNKYKGGKKVTGTDGKPVKRRDYKAPKKVYDETAAANRAIRKERERVNSLIAGFKGKLPEIKDSLAAHRLSRADQIEGLQHKLRTAELNSKIRAFGQNLPNIKADLAAKRTARLGKAQELASKMNPKWYTKLLGRLGGRKGKLLAAGLGGATIVGGGGAAAYSAYQNAEQRKREAAELAAQQELAELARIQQAADDKRSLYGNVGMAGGAIAGGSAGWGLGSALGGGTATKLLLTSLGAWGGGVGGKKLGEYLA